MTPMIRTGDTVTVILGWDIGGVNTKAVRLDPDGTLHARSRPFELQRDPGALVRRLTELASELGAAASPGLACAVTMTAELSQMFRTKRDGVHFVLEAVSSAFADADIRVFTTGGIFVSVEAARQMPLAVAAANWAATAHWVAACYSTALLVDVGTTTTDIIPIVDGGVAALGKTDPERLASGELVYTGAVRTPIEAVVRDVPYRGGRAAVSAEGFALSGDVHLWRGRLAPDDYTVPTPDGRAASREFAGERLARVICADREMLDESAIGVIADAVAAAQVETVAAAIRRVRARHPSVRVAVVTGLGEFIAREAALAAGLDVASLASDIGEDASRYAPAAAVALLAGPAKAGHHDRLLAGPAEAGHHDRRLPAEAGSYGKGRAGSHRNQSVDELLVIKVGGGLLATSDQRAGLKPGPYEHLDRVLHSIVEVARTQRVLVVPGGGPFADVVRDVDERLQRNPAEAGHHSPGLGDDAAHWMAILGMDQYAHLLASRMPSSVIVWDQGQIQAAHRSARIPILAPSRWLIDSDPLPHSWEVTSDSIAAWIASELRAAQLLVVKPPGARGADLVDAYFDRVRSKEVRCDVLSADEAADRLRQQATDLARSI
jgi:probable H4MPT-linked C1 transfer pathway protein